MHKRDAMVSTVSGCLARARCAAAGIVVAALAAAGGGPGAAAEIHPVKEALRAELASALAAKSYAVAPQAGETVVTVVEYYNAALRHFFITANPAEIANLDGGAFGGAWKRTGQTFGAWAMAGRPADSVPCAASSAPTDTAPTGRASAPTAISTPATRRSVRS